MNSSSLIDLTEAPEDGVESPDIPVEDASVGVARESVTILDDSDDEVEVIEDLLNRPDAVTSASTDYAAHAHSATKLAREAPVVGPAALHWPMNDEASSLNRTPAEASTSASAMSQIARPDNAEDSGSRPLVRCSVCFEAPVNCTATNCGHVFCNTCIRQAIAVNRKCPVCRKGLNYRGITLLELKTR
ncbi:hypothetical protein BZG36_04163 [Bifiguratus adelaidae]|uniref:RING-type domain-containing protein n=1 Tax=Bifiguratus adelaidae TaxID=1938954 RepID=A0A261XW73_9FUNG|nr:hypothetical protein BZG36_04163 [Bifiguratus adelaidae]